MQLDRDNDVTGGNPTVQPEPYREKLDLIDRLRSKGGEMLHAADELEAEVPPEYRKPPDEPPRQRRHLRLIEGAGIAAAVVGIGRWAQQNTAVAAVLVAGGSAAAGIALSPFVPPVLPGADRDSAGPAVTRTVIEPPVRLTITAIPDEPTPSAPPTGGPSPTAAPSPSPSPSPAATSPGPPGPTVTETEPAPAPTDDKVGIEDDEPPADSTPTAEPPATTPPPEVEPAAYCRVNLSLPPLLRVRAVCL